MSFVGPNGWWSTLSLLLVLLIFPLRAPAAGFFFKNNKCVNSKGYEGRNYGQFIECGKFRWKRLRSWFSMAGNYRGLDATGTSLLYSEFSDADFTKATLNISIIRKSSFKRALFKYAKFRGVTLEFVNLSKADFTGADLSGTKGRKVNFQDGIFRNVRAISFYCEKCNFANVDFRGADLRQSLFFDCNLEGIKVDEFTKWPAKISPDCRAAQPLASQYHDQSN